MLAAVFMCPQCEKKNLLGAGRHRPCSRIRFHQPNRNDRSAVGAPGHHNHYGIRQMVNWPPHHILNNDRLMDGRYHRFAD
ncbi:hypothetical protein QTP88_018492 [Uroleucon formosanum]